MGNKRIPEIRFQGFTGDWEERKFSNIVSRVSKQSNDANLPKVEFEDIISGEGRLNKDVSQKFDDRKGIVFEPNFILFGKLRPYLKNWLFPNFKGIALGDFWVFESKNSSSIFNYYLIQTDQYQVVANLSSGTKMPRSDWKTVSETKFRVPSIEEQTKIGDFFKQLDDTIALHQQELTTLKQTKQGFLQKMFPKEGESVPEVRFPGFTGEWEEHKLGDIADFFKGNGYTKSDLTDEGKPIILYGRLYTQYETVIESVDTFTIEKENSVLSQGNEVIVPSSGESSEDIARASAVRKSGIIFGGDLNIVRPSNKIDPVFLALTISNGKQQKELSKRAQGKSIVHLHNSDLKEVNLLIPKREEQTKIGNFFKKIDTTITLHQLELDALKETKKAFLQKMFV